MYHVQWLNDEFLGYLAEWEEGVKSQPGIDAKEKQRMWLSRETVEGLRVTGCLLSRNSRYGTANIPVSSIVV